MDIDQSEIEAKKELRRIYLKLRNKRRRNFILNGITIVLAIAGIVWACNFFLNYYRYEITNDATIEQYISPINTRVAGYISKIYFTDHQMVHEGDTLLIIDDREYRLKLMDAEAALKDAEASAEVLMSSITTTTSNVAVSQANIEEAKARLWKSEQDYKRYTNLLEADAVSHQQYDQVKTEYEAMKAHYNSLMMQQESLRSMSTETQKKRSNTDANILRKEADLALAKLNLSYTVITAPYSGYLGRRTLEEGQLVQAGQTVTNIVRDEGKWVIANYKEKQIQNIYIGQEINIKVDAIPDKVFKGKVTSISLATGSKYSLLPTDNSAGNFVKIQQRIPVRIDFVDIPDEDMEKLRAGMMVETEAIKSK
ncbi:membrane fusion protein (multidrug efflux system) [Dysgonomonas alginatilytica]|uniref:Membrane fusion protein (Multidrug efflux system) n=1 Tax=Dysgonomonas alginatilytica TaxID=1605892 RepID=A0A2V3PQP7_9BACT|nr:HlyD family secretion protein [Dysgonomonas alginatilytica]PXV64091.1 membrane fusion protein (multidrug efflux system) [Dysgonomonas alginatilytica]